MQRIVIELSRQVKRRYRRIVQRTKDAKLKTRYLIVVHSAEGRSRRDIAQMLQCASATVDRVRHRFVQEGEAGLVDRRGDNGKAKISDDYILTLLRAVEQTPRAYGHRRPTWTQELLIQVLARETGITMSRNNCSGMAPKPISSNTGSSWTAEPLGLTRLSGTGHFLRQHKHFRFQVWVGVFWTGPSWAGWRYGCMS